MTASATDRFLDLACLCYTHDAVSRREDAARLLAETPGLAADDIHVAAATGDVAAVRALLDATAALVNRRGGPRDWPPLLYLCYSRVTPPGSDVLATAQLLLARGADPNGTTIITECRFKALTGVMGEGEGGPLAHPPHPHSRALATLLLDAGADPNDSQGLYNTHFNPDNGWIELLTARGLTAEMNIAWDAEPAGKRSMRMLDWLLGEAARQGFTERVALLLARGASAGGSNWYNGRLHLENALLDGHGAIAALLRQHGATPPVFAPAEAFRVACLGADEGEARRLLAAHPQVAADPGPLLAAAKHGLVAAAHLWLALGLDVNGRDGAGLTALHLAGGAGHLDLVKLLITAGASFTARDHTYRATALDHAHHGAQHWPSTARREVLAYLLMHTTNPFDLVNRGGPAGRLRLRELAAADAEVARIDAALQLLERAYAAFNACDVEAALALLHADVDWPNALEGGRVRGRGEVRAYWTRQWQSSNARAPQVDPLYFRDDAQGRIVAEVHQVVRDPAGTVLTDQQVCHAYEVADGLVRRMEILPA
jgi:hypothetical protein